MSRLRVRRELITVISAPATSISITASGIIGPASTHNGKVLKTITSGSAGRIYTSLAMILKQNNFDISKLNKEVNKPRRAFYDSERKLFFKKQEYDRLNADYVKDPKKGKKGRVDKINKEYQEVVSKRDGCKSDFVSVLSKFMEEDSVN